MVFTIILFCDNDILIIDRVQGVLCAKSNLSDTYDKMVRKGFDGHEKQFFLVLSLHKTM